MQKPDFIQKLGELRHNYEAYTKIDLRLFAKTQFKNLTKKKLKIPITLFQL